MNDLHRHMRPVMLAIGLLASIIMGTWGGFAQTPVGTTIRNEAVGRFIYKSGEPDSIQSNVAEVVVAQSVPALQLDLQPSRTIVRRNEILQFTLRYRNPGSGPAVAINAADSLPPQVMFVYATRGGQLNGNRVIWNTLGSLQAGEEDSVVVSVRIRGDLMPPDSIVINRARISAANVSTVFDSTAVYIRFDSSNGTPLIEASKIVDLASARPGMTLNYALQVNNTGNGTASGVMVVDSLPSHTTFVAATNGGSVEGGAIVWRPDTLWASAGFGAGVTLRINADCPNGYLDNTAQVFADGTRTVIAGPARTLVSSALATNLSIALSSSVRPGNGVDSVQVCVTVRDGSGSPMGDGIPIVLTTSSGLFQNQQDSIVAFTSGGVACAVLRSPILAGKAVYALVEAKTVGANGTTISATAFVRFYPSAIGGYVLSAMGDTRIAGAIARVYDGFGQVVDTDTTETDGSYLIPIDISGVYSCVVSAANRFGERIEATFLTTIQVPAIGANPPQYMLSAISGSLVDRATGQRIQEQGIPITIEQIDQQKTSGGRSIPARMQTDSEGAFLIDSLGTATYALRVRTSIHSGSRVVVDTLLNALIIDANVGLDPIPGFEITKTVNKRIAEIGDAVTYTLEIRNMGGATPISGVRVVDQLPKAFVYASGSTKIDDLPGAEPEGSRKLEWQLSDTLSPGRTLRLSYMVTLGAAALESDCINRAYAVGRVGLSDSVQTPEASVQITVRPGVFTDRGIVIGKVFYDSNENGHQEEGERGISSVELWMEDGTRITTGDDGKYSLPEVLPGQHVMRVNGRTLPAGSALLDHGTEFAGDGTIRFIRLTESGIARADFFVRAPNQATVEMCLVRDLSDSAGLRQQAIYIVKWNTVGKPESVILQDTLPPGWHYVTDSSSVWPASGSLVTSGDPRMFKISLVPRNPGTSDVVRIGVAPDSIPGHDAPQAKGSLVLSYPMRRDAILDAKPLSVPMEYVDMLIARSETGRQQIEKTQTVTAPDAKKPLAVVTPAVITPKIEVSTTSVGDSAKSAQAAATQTVTKETQPAEAATQPPPVTAPGAVAGGTTPVGTSVATGVAVAPKQKRQEEPASADSLIAPADIRHPEIADRSGMNSKVSSLPRSPRKRVPEADAHQRAAEGRPDETLIDTVRTAEDALAGRESQGVAEDSQGAESVGTAEPGYFDGEDVFMWTISLILLIIIFGYLVRRYYESRKL